jgi:hypothetical protein
MFFQTFFNDQPLIHTYSPEMMLKIQAVIEYVLLEILVISSYEVIDDESFGSVSSSLFWATIGYDFELHSIFLHDFKESNVVHPYIYHLLE